MSNPKLERFVQWLSTPSNEREPQTQRELARELGLKETQLSAWKRELREESAEPETVAQLRRHILSEAQRSGNAQMAKLAWEIVNPRDEEQQEIELSPDDYISIAGEVTETLQRRFREGERVCPVCLRPALLSGELRLHTDQNQTPENS